MSTESAPAPAFRWLKAGHGDLEFWGIKGPLPWPAEDKAKIDLKRHFPFEKLLTGIQRLRADGRQWKKEWEAVETFIARGDALNDALEAGDLAEALRMLDELESLRPGTAYCAFNRAFVLRTQGDLAGAIAAATSASGRAPKIEYIWMRRGDLHEERGEEKDAIFCFRKALALLPNHMQALEGLARLGAMTKFTYHNPDGTHRDQYYTPEEFDRLVKENTARSKPDDPTLRPLLAQFRSNGKGRHALVLVDRILEGNPPDAALLRAWRADALRMEKRIGEARRELEKLLEDGESKAEAVYTLAWCDFDEGLVDEGWDGIAYTLVLDVNHEKALQVKFRVGMKNHVPAPIAEISAWAERTKSWRAHWLASVQASTTGDKATAVTCAEAAYRLAPQERDALFLYANALNNMDEGEHTAALIQPRLPETKGDFTLKYIFAGAMKKLGLNDEAIRILREVLTEEGDITVEWRGWAQHFLDELTGLIAQSEMDLEFHPNTEVLRRGIWLGDDKGPDLDFIHAAMGIPVERPVKMTPAPGFTGSTGSIAVYLHGHNTAIEPVSLGWFRAHEIEFGAAEPPMMTIHVTGKKKLEASARQGTRRLPVTWSLYRVPSMETERAPE